ncbi:hypothetical protein ACPOM7_17565 [Peribacillus castrilensis]|uniref:hypothetical protein n=1 Tax=Bacillaceae TaxID=186817 RepID=UPI0006605BCB|nr:MULTISPECIES: hypothetical protein [Bacillaceae]PRA81576.1 hypothetical protein CQ056_20460 [Peribacillus simplex]
MLIADNIIKHHFQNIYIVTGGACGGKTTVSRYLANKYNFILYNWDEHHSEYQEIASSEYQPAMSKRPNFTSWEEYFMRPVEEYSEWLDATFLEQTEMVVTDLLRISGRAGSKKIIVDGFFSVELLKRISDYSKVVFLISSEKVVRHDYFNRADKRDMYECIKGLKNSEAAFENVFRTMFHKADELENAIQESGFKCFKRETLGTDPMHLIRQVEEHFGFDKEV